MFNPKRLLRMQAFDPGKTQRATKLLAPLQPLKWPFHKSQVRPSMELKSRSLWAKDSQAMLLCNGPFRFSGFCRAPAAAPARPRWLATGGRHARSRKNHRQWGFARESFLECSWKATTWPKAQNPLKVWQVRGIEGTRRVLIT